MTTLRVAFCLPGLHRVVRGAEVAFESIARALAKRGDFQVTAIGSGDERAGEPYSFLHAPCRPREKFEKWPSIPLFRTDSHYEEATFVPSFLRAFQPHDYDIVVTCSYPFMNWAVRATRRGRPRPLHVYVTQNGDWPLYGSSWQTRPFRCDAIVCTNPDYYDQHGTRWPSRLIPNGVDTDVFCPGPSQRELFGLPKDVRVVLMVSAFIPSKRVLEGISAMAGVPDAHLVVAGDGPLREQADQRAKELLDGRFHRLRVSRERMPALYRSANLFLHMSLDEPSANAYIEALASGLPIVTHDRRVTRWTLGDHAALVDSEDLPAVTEAVTRVLAAPPDTRPAVDEARRRFAWRSIGGDYADFFRELTKH
jgi:glycosyltransferase involved in cell wall biosynthesis